MAKIPPYHKREPCPENALASRDTANFGAPLVNFPLDLVANLPGHCEFVLGCPLKTGRVCETPMQPLGDAGKNWATLRAGLVANGDDCRRMFSLDWSMSAVLFV